MKIFFLILFAATSLLLYSTPSIAVPLSIGIPIGYTVTGKTDGEKTVPKGLDSLSGLFLAGKFPSSSWGYGYDRYDFKFKESSSEMELQTYYA